MTKRQGGLRAAAIRLGSAIAITGAAVPAMAQGDWRSDPWGDPQLSFVGTPGMIDMPSAWAPNDGTISLGVAQFGETTRLGFSFQITPRIGGSLRYGIIPGFDGGNTRFDRGFDLRFLLAEEGDRSPSVMLGLQDFGGTGIYSGEYIALGKTYGRLRVTGGIGWGRFGSYNGFENPLNFLSDSFRERTGGASNISTTGQLSFDSWFSGDAALFAGVQYRATERLTLTLEYSSDAYTREELRLGYTQDTPFNVAASYRVSDDLSLTAAYLYGNTFGFMASYQFDPRVPRRARQEGQGPAVVPRTSAAALGWDGLDGQVAPGVAAGATDPLAARLSAALKAQGVELISFRDQGSAVELRILNHRYLTEAQAVGRAARVLTGLMPARVETFVLIPQRHGADLSRITLARSDLEELSTDLEASWKSLARASITEAPAGPKPWSTGSSKPFFGLDFYSSTTFSNPDNFFAENGLRFDASWEALPGLTLSTRMNLPLFGTGEGPSPDSTTSNLTRVRSDAGLYDSPLEFEVERLQADYVWRPAENLYARVSAGYFERMYGGVSTELLWKPVSGPLALGAEVNYLRKRSIDDIFGFRDFDTTTAFVSAYYDFGNGYLARVDAGQYMAGDIGTTVSLDREFANGVTVGAWFTLTDVPQGDFGEGSFDKGIRISLPLSWFTGKPSRREFQTQWRPVNNDGGARAEIAGRLYEQVRHGHRPELQESWGTFWE